MIRNALITSYRTIVNNKTYTIINITGLVLGLTAAFVLLVFAINETSYNSCFPKQEQLYRVILTDSKGVMVPGGSKLIKTMLLKKIPACKNIARIIHNQDFPDKVKVVYKNKTSETTNFICADKEIFGMLNMNFTRGGIVSGSYLTNRLFISENAVQKYFDGNVNLFQTVRVDVGKSHYNLILAGIYNDLPWNSTLKADFITDLPFYEVVLKDELPDFLREFNSYGSFTVESLCEFSPGTDVKNLTARIPVLLNEKEWKDTKNILSFQAIRDFYLGSADLQNNSHLSGNKLSVYTYSWLAVFILLLAGINYAILSTARSALRFKEIGVRKVLGATKRELRIQILIESVLLTLMALPLALFVLGLIDPRITGIPDYTVTIYASNMPSYIICFAGITLIIGILSGLYVAIYLAGLNPINALKARYFTPGKFNLSKIFIGFQLFITLSLLICMITIYTQIRLCYISNLSIGRENILLLSLKASDFQKYTLMKSRLGKISDVISYSGTALFSLPSSSIATAPARIKTSKDPVLIEWTQIDREFFKTLGIPLVRGRDFDSSSLNRNEIECIFNEEAIKALGIKQPVGSVVNQAKIVGVVRDFNLHTLHNRINATNFLYNPYAINTLIIHYKQGCEKSVIQDIQAAWEKIYPKIPFNYSFYKQELRNAYQKENNFVIAVAVFTILAFIITGMGLFGLALLISERKTKETAIRKVFGASNIQIIFRMQKEFLLYTALATVVAIPVSWLLMELWLKEFYYRVNISLWVMLLCVLAVTLFVSTILLVRTLKVLRSNPVNALKYE
ncbi:MAG: FtsX-like permease family protein [Bacteroidetes bacterium]|nr:MAG: FtsX-like permease family protein [Bacteroidota bacterium]